MCFKISPYHPVVKIAQSDIECWKAVFKSGPLRTGKYWKPICQLGIIYKPFVVCPKVEVALNYDYIEEGYHSYHSEEVCKNAGWVKDAIKKFIIPSGTRYYENDTEYVSETIMLVE